MTQSNTPLSFKLASHDCLSLYSLPVLPITAEVRQFWKSLEMNTAEMSFHFPAILFATLAILCGWCDQSGLACIYPSQLLVLEAIYQLVSQSRYCDANRTIIPLNYKNKYGFIRLWNNYILNSTQKDYTNQHKAVKHHNQKSCHPAWCRINNHALATAEVY